VAKPRSSDALFPYVLVAIVLLVVVAGLAEVTGVAGESTPKGDGVAVRMDTLALAGATEARGYGRMKIINDSGRTVSIRLIGPQYRDSQTLLVPSWQDRVVTGLAPGEWTVKYCVGDDCRELIHPIKYEETIPDGNLHYTAAVIRFGPSPAGWPAGHRIGAEDFNAD